MKTIQLNGISTPYEFYYDESKRLTSAKTPDGYTLTNVYEVAQNNPANGLRTSFTESLNGLNANTIYAYDGLQRLSSITTATGKSYNYFYNESSQPVRLQSTSSIQLFDFDANGQLTNQSILAKDFLQLRYQYQENGNIKTYFDGKKTNTFVYDFADRLSSWDNGNKVSTYDYDDAGNLLNLNGKSFAYNEANEIKGFTYDFEGNLTNDNRQIYSWDGLGQLTQTEEIANQANKVTYTYHPDGLRKSKTVGSTTYNYYYDGSNLVRVTDENQKTIWAITWNNGKVVNLTNAAGESFEYVTNHRGDVVRILDQNGNTIATYEYDPWGNLLSTEPSDSRIKGQPIRYAGYVYDSETKLYYLQARYYDPATARFISRDLDPGNEDDPVTMNGYSYADDNPIMMIDPDGNWAQLVYYAIVGARSIKISYKTYKALKKAGKSAKAVRISKIKNKKIVAPQKAKNVLNKIKKNKGKAPSGYVGGRIFKNHEGKLPKNTKYREYDINPYVKGKNRGKERLVIGENGSAWYTNNHYESFVRIK